MGVVVGMEVGGRWSKEASKFVSMLAKARARSVPPLLRKSTQMAFYHRWTALLSVAAQRAFADTLLGWPVDESGLDGDEPHLEEVLLDARLAEAPAPSRLP